MGTLENSHFSTCRQILATFNAGVGQGSLSLLLRDFLDQNVKTNSRNLATVFEYLRERMGTDRQTDGRTDADGRTDGFSHSG